MSRRRILIMVATAVAITAGPVGAAQTDAPKPAKESRAKAETVAKGLASPWGLQFLPDGRLLVTEKPGRLRVVTRDGKVGAPISGVPKVFASGQGGLLDVLLAKDFGPKGGDIYLSLFRAARGRGGCDGGGTRAADARRHRRRRSDRCADHFPAATGRCQFGQSFWVTARMGAGWVVVCDYGGSRLGSA